MKKLAACLLVVGLMFTACTGSFKMTRAVYDFHRSQTKVMDEVLFLVFALTPVYWVAGIGDAIVLNTIEFWTGKNPMASTTGTTNTVVKSGHDKAILSYDSLSGNVTVTSAKEPGKAIVISRTDAGVTACDENGKVLFTSEKNGDGSVTVYNAEHEAVRTFSSLTVEQERQGLLD